MATKRHHNIDPLIRYAEATGKTFVEISQEMGYSKAAGSEWKKTNSLPVPVAIALQARLKQIGPPPPRVMIAAIPTDSQDVIERFFSAMGVDYKFVEIE